VFLQFWFHFLIIPRLCLSASDNPCTENYFRGQERVALYLHSHNMSLWRGAYLSTGANLLLPYRKGLNKIMERT